MKDADIDDAGPARPEEGWPAMKIRKELWFGFSLMALIGAAALTMVLSVETMTNGHYGLLMLSLVVVAIMLGFPTAFTLMGMGMMFAFFAYHSGDADRGRRHAADAGPDGAARVLGDGQRRADLDPAVRVHGLPRGTRQPDRQAVPQPAPGPGPRARLAGRGHAGDLCGVRHRHRHRGRGRHADGPAGPAADAARRLRRAPVGRCHHRRRLPGHPDPALGAADRLRRHRRRVGGAAVRRCLLPRHHAGRSVHPVRDHHGQGQAGLGAAAHRSAALRAACRHR